METIVSWLVAMAIVGTVWSVLNKWERKNKSLEENGKVPPMEVLTSGDGMCIRNEVIAKWMAKKQEKESAL